MSNITFTRLETGHHVAKSGELTFDIKQEIDRISRKTGKLMEGKWFVFTGASQDYEAWTLKECKVFIQEAVELQEAYTEIEKATPVEVETTKSEDGSGKPVTVIYTTDGVWHIHGSKCKDLKAKKYQLVNHRWETSQFSTQNELIDDTVSDFLPSYDSAEELREAERPSFKFYACTKLV